MTSKGAIVVQSINVRHESGSGSITIFVVLALIPHTRSESKPRGCTGGASPGHWRSPLTAEALQAPLPGATATLGCLFESGPAFVGGQQLVLTAQPLLRLPVAE